MLDPTESFAGVMVGTPVIAVHGMDAGPVLCLTAGIHGDELNGVEIVRRVLAALDPIGMKGSVIAVPISNPHGFRRSSRYLPDRRDLNRFFPGRPNGSSASRIAASLFERVIRHCDRLVDFHTGSFHRTNIPQLRADLREPKIRDLARSFGAEIVVHSPGRQGTLRRSAAEEGIPSVTYEAGEPMRLNEEHIAFGEEGTHILLAHLGIAPAETPKLAHRFYLETHWVRADSGGLLRGMVQAGARIQKDQVLGVVTDPISSDRTEIRAPYAGRVLGRAFDQVVLPGFASFHIAVDHGKLPTDAETESDFHDLPDDAAPGLEPDMSPE